MAVTIKDVAVAAGVSPSTVSRVCNDSPSISRETKEKVRRAMAKLGYEPAASAPAQPTGQGLKLVGIILPPSAREAYENSFYLEVIRGINKFCNRRQVASIVLTGKDEEELLHSVKNLSASGQVDGFIMLYSKQDDPVVDYLCEEGILYVVIGKANQFQSQTICIDNDNLLAGREATDYLYGLGHRRIGYLGCEEAFIFSADRRSGYQLSLLQHGLPVEPEYCLEIEDVARATAEPIRRMLSREDRPTAFVVSDDILAVTLERICLQMGLRIPEDVSIISFNNSLFARLSGPQLTSVDINSIQLGYEAASQILNHAENPNLLATKILVPHEIVERDSCKRLDVEE